MVDVNILPQVLFAEAGAVLLNTALLGIPLLPFCRAVGTQSHTYLGVCKPGSANV